MQIITETLKQTDDEMLKANMGTIITYSKISGRFDDDLFNEQLLNFYKAKEKFDRSKKANFNTFLHIFLKSRRSNYIRDKKYNMVDYEIDKTENEVNIGQEYLEQVTDDVDLEKDYIQKETMSIISHIISTLNDRSQYIIEQRIYTDKTFREIAEELGLSKQGVNQNYKKSLKTIKQRLGEFYDTIY